ncbi:hypothetical protein Tco_1250499 [Tanacetum coccineum]
MGYQSIHQAGSPPMDVICEGVDAGESSGSNHSMQFLSIVLLLSISQWLELLNSPLGSSVKECSSNSLTEAIGPCGLYKAQIGLSSYVLDVFWIGPESESVQCHLAI